MKTIEVICIVVIFGSFLLPVLAAPGSQGAEAAICNCLTEAGCGNCEHDSQGWFRCSVGLSLLFNSCASIETNNLNYWCSRAPGAERVDCGTLLNCTQAGCQQCSYSTDSCRPVSDADGVTCPTQA